MHPICFPTPASLAYMQPFKYPALSFSESLHFLCWNGLFPHLHSCSLQHSGFWLKVISSALGFPRGWDGKESVCNAGDPAFIPSWEDALEKGMATHSSILAWRSPWIQEPGRLQSMGSNRVAHDWVTLSLSSESFKPNFHKYVVKHLSFSTNVITYLLVYFLSTVEFMRTWKCSGFLPFYHCNQVHTRTQTHTKCSINKFNCSGLSLCVSAAFDISSLLGFQ